VRYSSFSAALAANGLRRLGSLRNAGTGGGPGSSKVSSATNDEEGAVGASVAGVGGSEEGGTPAGGVDEVLRPVRLSHLGVRVSNATGGSAVSYMDMAAMGPVNPVELVQITKAYHQRRVSNDR
jgi:hypothetical protein